MIKDQMTLALSVDTQYLKTTVDAMQESDETLAAYAVGFIPWDMVQESTLFSWTYYHGEYASGVNGYSRVTLQENPYTDDTQLAATKGIPFSYVADSTAVYVMRGLQKDPDTGTFASAGNDYHSGTNFTTTSTKHLVYSTDLSNIVTSQLYADPYFDVCFCAMAVQYDDETYSYSNCQGHFSADTRYNPITDSIPDVVFSFTINGETFTYTLTDNAFKTFTRLGLQTTITTANHTYAVFVYCIGIWCNARISNYYYSGFIADNLPFRYSGGIGVHRFDAYDQSGIGSFGFYSSNVSSPYETAQGIEQTVRGVDKMTFCNTDAMPTINIVLTNENGAEIADNYMMYSHYYHFSMVCKSFNATDLKIMALISAPIIRVDSIYYCPEYDENYALTGNWVQYNGQTLNPDDNEFDPADIPEPEPGEDPENMGDRITRPASIGIGGTNGFVTQYALNRADVAQLGALLWTSFVDQDYWKNYLFSLALDTGTFQLSGLLNFFVSLKVYPFPLVNVDSFRQWGQDMYIGTGIVPLHFSNNIHVINNYCDYVSGGYIEIPRYFNDYRDYINTEIMLYLPFCGTVQLNPGDVIGNRIDIQYAIDFATGGCIAYVDLTTGDGAGFPVGALPGQIGADIPLTATAAGEVAARFIGDGMNVAGMLSGEIGRTASGVAGALGGNPAGGGSGGGSVLAGVAGMYGGAGAAMAADMAPSVARQGMQMLQRGAVSAPMLSGGRGFAAFGAPSKPYVQIRRGIYPELSGLHPVEGAPAARTVSIGTLSGFVQGTVKADGLSCHQAEKEEIIAMIATGIYV